MSSAQLKSDIVKAEAMRLGFSHCGLAPAEEVDEAYMHHYEQWLSEGRQAEMHYMENHLALRRDPRLLLPGTKTIVSLTMSYNPGEKPTQPAIAWYAQGCDYHDVIRQRLQISRENPGRRLSIMLLPKGLLREKAQRQKSPVKSVCRMS